MRQKTYIIKGALTKIAVGFTHKKSYLKLSLKNYKV